MVFELILVVKKQFGQKIYEFGIRFGKHNERKEMKGTKRKEKKGKL